MSFRTFRTDREVGMIGTEENEQEEKVLNLPEL